jgi:uncharacterized protein YndB with AHSA1/START domain
MPDIRHAISIDASPARIYPLIATGAGFEKWWAADVHEEGFGKIVELGFFNRTTLYRLQLVREATAQEAEWLCHSGQEWKDTKLLFQLSPAKGQTLLRFAHSNWQQETDYFISCNTTWGELMFRLKAAAEGKQPGPLFSATGMGY